MRIIIESGQAPVLWMVNVQPDGSTIIQRLDKTLGIITEQVPCSKQLFQIALEGICVDISAAVEDERRKANVKPFKDL